MSGSKAKEIFQNESGGHRFQRVPPTERRGRVHTSTITVAVLDDNAPQTITVREGDLEIKTCRSGGPGGQNVQKTNSAVQVTHIPTGLYVRRDEERSQMANKANAIAAIKKMLSESKGRKYIEERNKERREQIGSGARDDKIRTVRMQDDIVTDHRTGNKTSFRRYSSGDFSQLV